MANPTVPPVPQLTKEGFADPVWQRWLIYLRARVAAVVLSVAINTANGFNGTVTTDVSGNSKVTIGITVTGLLKGSGGGIVAAVAGTDYIIGVTATAPLSQSGGGTPTISMTQSSGSVNGWLSSTDWNTFNNKMFQVSLTGDVTGTSSGNPNATLAAVLAASGVTAATYGSATQSVQVTFNAKGLATAASSVLITPAFSSITSTPTTATGYGIVSIDNIPIGATTQSTVAATSLKVKEGANAKQGTATLAAGTVVVSNTSVTANSRIFLAAQDNNSVGALRVSARTAGTSFTITSSNNTDTGVVAYEIFEPA